MQQIYNVPLPCLFVHVCAGPGLQCSRNHFRTLTQTCSLPAPNVPPVWTHLDLQLEVFKPPATNRDAHVSLTICTCATRSREAHRRAKFHFQYSRLLSRLVAGLGHMTQSDKRTISGFIVAGQCESTRAPSTNSPKVKSYLIN